LKGGLPVRGAPPERVVGQGIDSSLVKSSNYNKGSTVDQSEVRRYTALPGQLTDKLGKARVVYVDPENPLRCGVELHQPRNIWGVPLPPDDRGANANNHAPIERTTIAEPSGIFIIVAVLVASLVDVRPV
jgi:hypothetical protein